MTVFNLTDEDLIEAVRKSREADELVATLEFPRRQPALRARLAGPVTREFLEPAPEAPDWQTWTEPDMGMPVERPPLPQPPLPPVARVPMKGGAPSPAVATAPLARVTDDELDAAMAADERSRLARGIERVGRNFSAALSGRPAGELAIAPGGAEQRLLGERRLARELAAAQQAADLAQRRAVAADKTAEARRLSSEAFDRQSRTQADVAPEKVTTAKAAEERRAAATASDVRIREESNRLREEELRAKKAKQAARAGGQGSAGVAPERDVQKLSKLLAGSAAVMSLADELMPFVNSTGDIPGVGPWDSLKAQIPGQPFSTPQDIRTSGAAQRLNATILKEMSGQGVSAAEAQRYLELLGLTPGSGEERFRQGVRLLKEMQLATMQQTEAGFRPEVVDTFQKRGGTVSKVKPVIQAKPPPPDGMVRVIDSDGTELEMDADAAEEAIAEGIVRRAE